MFCVIYDGNCNLCVSLVRLLETLDQGRQFRYLPMQEQAPLASLGIAPEDCEAGMILVDLNHPERRWQGSDAAEEIGRQMPLGRGFVQAYRALPGAKAMGDQTYGYIRDHRYGLFGQRDQRYDTAYPWCATGNCQPMASRSKPNPRAE